MWLGILIKREFIRNVYVFVNIGHSLMRLIRHLLMRLIRHLLNNTSANSVVEAGMTAEAATINIPMAIHLVFLALQ